MKRVCTHPGGKKSIQLKILERPYYFDICLNRPIVEGYLPLKPCIGCVYFKENQEEKIGGD